MQIAKIEQREPSSHCVRGTTSSSVRFTLCGTGLSADARPRVADVNASAVSRADDSMTGIASAAATITTLALQGAGDTVRIAAQGGSAVEEQPDPYVSPLCGTWLE